jgi:hypothetical protein
MFSATAQVQLVTFSEGDGLFPAFTDDHVEPIKKRTSFF